MHRLRYNQTALRNYNCLVEANKTLGNINLVPYLQDSQQPYQVSKAGQFLAGAGILRYFRGIEKKGTHPTL